MITMLLIANLLLNAEAKAMEDTDTKVESQSETRSERIRTTFDEVRVDTLHLLDDLYAEEMVFEDPLGRMEGLDEFRLYMEAMYQYVEDIEWEYTDEVVQGDTHVLFWTMTLQTKRLNKGKPFTVDGTSRLVFGENNKVIFHRDYFDMGTYIYERAPVVRWFVNFVKRRLHKAVEETKEALAEKDDGQ